MQRVESVRLIERADVLKDLDHAIFIDFCEVCGDFEDARIRWVDTTEDGENSPTKVVGERCIWKVENKCNDGVTGEQTLLHHRQVLRRVHPERVALEYDTAHTTIRTKEPPLSRH